MMGPKSRKVRSGWWHLELQAAAGEGRRWEMEQHQVVETEKCPKSGKY